MDSDLVQRIATAATITLLALLVRPAAAKPASGGRATGNHAGAGASVQPARAEASSPPNKLMTPQQASRVGDPRAALPAWIRWLGWSAGGTRFALRLGPHGTRNRVGRPIWLARIDRVHRIVDQLYHVKSPKAALKRRRIARTGRLYSERVGANDVLLRTRKRRLFAVVLRGTPPVVAILRRDRGTYRVVASQPARTPALRLRARGFETKDGKTVAIIARTGTTESRQATLFILPTAPSPTRGVGQVVAGAGHPGGAATASNRAPITPGADRHAQTRSGGPGASARDKKASGPARKPAIAKAKRRAARHVAPTGPDEAHTAASLKRDATARTRH